MSTIPEKSPETPETDELDTPFQILTIKWMLDDDEIVVDTRGTSLIEAYSILKLASDAVRMRMEEPILITDDEDVEYEEAMKSIIDDEDDEE